LLKKNLRVFQVEDAARAALEKIDPAYDSPSSD
jgi:hypothetical protein